MIEGGCNCGAIRYTIEGAPLDVVACHCLRCQRQSGSAYSVNLLISPAVMTIVGVPSVFYDADTSSGMPVLREFCSDCGSPIRSVLKANPDIIAVKAGTLDNPEPYAPRAHVFTRSKLQWVELAAGTTQFSANPDLRA